MNLKTKKTLLIITCIISIMGISFGAEIKLEDRVINPEGWNLPCLEKLIKVSSEVKQFPGIEQKIQIETYESKELYFIRNKKIVTDLINTKPRIVPDSYERYYILDFCIYKIYENQKILFFELYSGRQDDESESITDDPYAVSGGYAGVPILFFIVDLDEDGKYESLFIGEQEREEVLLFVLKLKLDKLEKKNK